MKSATHLPLPRPIITLLRPQLRMHPTQHFTIKVTVPLMWLSLDVGLSTDLDLLQPKRYRSAGQHPFAVVGI